MQLLVFTWPNALIFWVAFVWAFGPESVALRNEGWATPQDANSKRILMLAQGFGMVAAFAIALTAPIGALPHPMAFFWAGVIALIAGRLIRRHCRRMLGLRFTGIVIVNADHAVVEQGAYRYVRHPSYTAAVIIFLGVGSALTNWISLVTLAAIVVVAFLYRVKVEERALAAVIGDPYRSYMRRTKRFLPFVF